ncbi:Alpha-glucosidase, glycosyl hydrolase family GH31 [Lacrimispora sphenoides]|jgi:alpha-glucosidase (family GH31 glycosyl hydrolase)|uniref:TIM-barrel domain-containing protein n=1 Tax=Lacrimispora sphenoides TaxID=29370 RepID=UPI0008B10D50|nr:TIM-barrel domain-containing protein [Lacrimispora sphenoides]SEU23235.1 Alpha-glucosidase, glycosyl hydrolase family GH31 [Lacrimispora sphenoides]
MKQKKRFLSLSLIFTLLFTALWPAFVPAPARAAVSALGDVIGTQVNGATLVLTVDSGSSPSDKLTLEVCDEDILRVNYQPDGVVSSERTPMIDPGLKWDASAAVINTTSDPMTIKTDEMQVEINKKPCRMTVKKADGTTLFWEPQSGGVYHDGVRFVRQDSTNLYGIHSFDCFDENGNLLRNDNTQAARAGQQGNSGGPFLWSTAGYGLLVDSDGGYPYTNSRDKKMEFYYGGTPVEGRRYEKDNVEYFILLGEPKEIMKGYSKITGTSPMLPKWAQGFSNFEWGINEQELMEMIDTYRAKNIPLDSYAFDYDWKLYGQDNYGEFKWNTGNFPSAGSGALKNTMDAKGVKMIGITKPRIVTKISGGTTTAQGQDAANNGYFYPGHNEYVDYFYPVTVRSIDPYKSGERAWWWNHSIDAFTKGIVGWWNDETDKVSSNGAEYWFGNYNTLHLAQSIYEGQRDYSKNNTRVWQTGRNYYPGTQRFATSIWSGDVATQFYKGERVSWAAGLNEQKAALLSTVNNGQPKWGSDGGGFNQNSGTIENPSPELYTRWLQFESVVPVFRVHGNLNQQRQPWYYGYTAEENVKAAIHLRYSLMPYFYAYEREAYESGLGLVRPLLFDYPQDDKVKDYSDAWMLGDWLLAAPVTERGQSCKWIYLPEGNWIDYNRGTAYKGGEYIPYSLDTQSWSDLPLFVKEGAIIPSQDVEDYVGQKETERIFVDIFPSSQKTEFQYYDDDGITYDYENGTYFSQTISGQKSSGQVNVGISAKSGSYKNGVDYYYLAVHGSAAGQVKKNASQLQEYADLNALFAANGGGFANSRDIYGEVTYIKTPAGLSNADTLVLTGNPAVTLSDQKYEAEYASLSGKTVAGQPQVGSDHTGFSGTGFVNGMETEQAAVTFYAKTANPGDYEVTLRCSNVAKTAKTLSAYVNGTYSGQADIASTGNWDSWGDVKILLPLTAGSNSITFKYDPKAGDTGFVNIDYLAVPFEPERMVIEAENAPLYGTAKTNQDHWFYSGSGFVDTMVSQNAEVAFEVDMEQGGAYTADFRYSNGNQSTKDLNLYVNGIYADNLQFAASGGNWNIWKTVSTNLALSKGRNRISLRYDAGNSGNINLDKLTLSGAGSGTYRENLLDNGDFERPTSFNFNWTEWHPSGQALAYGIDSGSGTNKPESPVEGDKRAYFYHAAAYEQSIHQGLNVENGSYRVEAFVKVVNTSPGVGRMEITNYGGNAVYVDMPKSGSGWHKIEAGNVLVTNGTIDVGFYCSSSGGTTVHIDDVRLYRN